VPIIIVIVMSMIMAMTVVTMIEVAVRVLSVFVMRYLDGGPRASRRRRPRPEGEASAEPRRKHAPSPTGSDFKRGVGNTLRYFNRLLGISRSLPSTGCI
jgi:hypothetical protein